MIRAALVPAVLLVVLVASAGCAGSGEGLDWDRELTESERAALAEALPAEAVRQLIPLSEIFYARITSRRFDSRATFEDPSVRQFFPSVAAYSDYYAALVDELDRAHIRYNRPTRIEWLGVEIAESGNLLMSLRFIGRNDLPLRWWDATLERQDEWSWNGVRWFVVPGKV